MTDDETQQATRDVLVAVARDGATITYEELLDRVDPTTRAVLRTDMARVLRAISTEEDAAERGLLTAVVVRAESGRPGKGWYALAAARGRDVGDPDTTWAREIAFVHEVWHGA